MITADPVLSAIFSKENFNDKGVILFISPSCVKPNSEYAFKHQKEIIKEMKGQFKKKNNTEKLDINEIIISSEKELKNKKRDDGFLLTLSDQYLWDYSAFDFENIDGDSIPLISCNSNWETFPPLQHYSSSKGVELRKIALRSTIDINYEACGIEITANFLLKGESSFWIFTRSFVNKDINEDKDFDAKSIFNSKGEVFNKYSSIIRISKEDKSQKCFVSLSTFYEEEGQLQYKTFCKRQLINFSAMNKPNNQAIENDSCEFRLFLIDQGEEKITAKIFVNDSKKENDVSGEFFLPISKHSRLMFAGCGQSSTLKSLMCKMFLKDDRQIQFTADRKNCDCCLLY